MKVKMDEALKRATVFAILMQKGDGLTSKSPDYVFEKWYASQNVEEPESLLDPHGLQQLVEWAIKWKVYGEDVNP